MIIKLRKFLSFEIENIFGQTKLNSVTPLLFKQCWIMHGLVNGRAWVPLMYGLMPGRKFSNMLFKRKY